LRQLSVKGYTQAQFTLWKTNYNKTLSNCYKVVIKELAWRERVGVAWGVYAGRIQTNTDLTLTQQNDLSVLKAKKINKKGWVFVVSALIAVQGVDTAHAANYSIDHLKLYAHSRLLDYKEFQCFNKIITKESRWSYTARNGSHWGLGQMRSTHYRDLDPFRQIDATIHYITKRYKAPCKAWAFHMKHGYY
tara:strand:+ start:399 stop:968 length:570 start_codon:yes stop_codon:yes gene_type:complete